MCLSHLDHMQFGQQVAVCQRQAVAIEILSLGDSDVFCGVVVNLLWERRVQIDVQTFKLPQQSLLLYCEAKK